MRETIENAQNAGFSRVVAVSRPGQAMKKPNYDHDRVGGHSNNQAAHTDAKKSLILPCYSQTHEIQ